MTTLFGMDYNDNHPMPPTQPQDDNFFADIYFDPALFKFPSESPITNTQSHITKPNDAHQDTPENKIKNHLNNHSDSVCIWVTNMQTKAQFKYINTKQIKQYKGRDHEYTIKNNIKCQCNRKFADLNTLVRHITNFGHTICAYCNELMLETYQPRELTKNKVVLEHVKTCINKNNPSRNDLKCQCAEGKWESIHSLQKHIIKKNHYDCAYCGEIILNPMHYDD